MKLKTKFNIPISSILIVIVISSGLFSYFLVSELISRQLVLVEKMNRTEMEGTVQQTINRFYSDINTVGLNAIKMASSFSMLPEVLDAYQIALNGNIDDESDTDVQIGRDQIRSFIKPVIEKFKKDTGATALQLHYHLANNRSFVRTWREGWQTKRNGKKIDISDDLSTFRKTVVKINQGDHKPIHGIEVGRGGFVIRGLAPITLADGTHAGSNEVLIPFEAVLKQLYSAKSSQIAVYMDAALLPVATKLQDKNRFPVLDGKYVLTTATNKNVTDDLIKSDFLDKGFRESYSEIIGSYYITASPITDFSGHSVGVILLAKDITSYIQLMEKAEETGGDITTWLFYMIGGAVFLTFIIVYFLLTIMINRIIIRPLNQSLDFAKNVSEGDFTSLLDVDRKDEIGSLMEAFNMIVKSFNDVFIRISQNIIRLSSTSNELSSISQGILKSSEKSSENANSVASATEQMSSNMNTVAAAGEEASVNIHSLSTTVSELNNTVNEIAQNTQRATTITDKAVDLVSSSSEKVDALGLATEEIGQVTEVISAVSDKTDLLALNATIEAARAGDAGKGFAVVAAEIKMLANQTASSTLEIQKKIKAIQESVGSTVIEIKQISEVIYEVNEIVSTITNAVNEQAGTTGEIAENVQQAAIGIDEVAENVTQSSAVSAEIAQDITLVSQATGEFTYNSSQINSNSEDLAEIANNLKDMLSKFRISSQDIEAVEEDTGKQSLSIAPLMKWQDSYNLKIKKIDMQHQRLVDLINGLHAAMKTSQNTEKVGKTLDSLVDYTTKHFSYEENLMTRYDYPDYPDHKVLHENLVKKVLSFKRRIENKEAFVSMELMEFLKEWLIDHILGTDKKYAPFFIEKMGGNQSV